jgi:hypothetical protein
VLNSRGDRFVKGIRPDDLVYVDVDIEFNLKKFTSLEIDLRHINNGSKATRSTQYSVDEVVEIVRKFLNNQMVDEFSKRDYGNITCEYFSVVDKFKGKKYKLIICECSDRPDAIGVITLFRVWSNDEKF